MKYIEWNDKIAEYFFNPDKAGEPVLLAVERKVIEEIAEQNNTTYNDFIAAVKQGHELGGTNQRDKICATAHKTFNNPQNQKSPYPIYIAYLALFVLAVTHGDRDDFSAHDYYGRLRDILGEGKDTGTYPSYSKMLDLWDDLEKWSIKTKNGELGEFNLNIHGQHMHVGIPIYQVALTSEDIKSLPKIFHSMGWDSSSNPNDTEIEQALKENKKDFADRTEKRITSGTKDFFHVLRNRFREELMCYSDEYDTDDSIEGEEKLYGQVVLCADIDEDNESIEFYFRCKRAKGLPSEFVLEKNCTVTTSESDSSFSKKIDNFDIPWEKSKTFSTDKMYQFSYVSHKYKLFTSGKKFFLRDYVSGERYSNDEQFFLCVHKDIYEKTKEWGSAGVCEEFEELASYEGLPKGWHLFKIKDVKDDKNIKKYIPALAIDTEIRVTPYGGIRLGRGSKFFVFSPPQIQVVGTDNVYVETEDGSASKLEQSTDNSGFFSLPEDTPYNTWLTIKAKVDDEKKPATRRLMLADTSLSKQYDYSKSKVDRFGDFGEAGSSLEALTADENFPRVPAGNISFGKKIYYVGNNAGEVSDTYPDDWTPVWTINYLNRKKKKAEAIYHGSSDTVTKSYPVEQERLWQKVIWHNRKKIAPQPNAGKQWRQLLARANDVR